MNVTDDRNTAASVSVTPSLATHRACRCRKQLAYTSREKSTMVCDTPIRYHRPRETRSLRETRTPTNSPSENKAHRFTDRKKFVDKKKTFPWWVEQRARLHLEKYALPQHMHAAYFTKSTIEQSVTISFPDGVYERNKSH